MRKFFPESYPLTDEELDQIWKDSLVVFDTNVLLRFFRYKSNTIDEIFSVMRNLDSRMWIPYQVGWEYNRNRLGKIRESKAAYRKFFDLFTKVVADSEVALRDVKDFGLHPLIQVEEEFAKLTGSVRDTLSKIEKDYAANVTGPHYASIHDRIGDFFGNKVGSEQTETELKQLYSDGKKRFEANVPPGQRDVVAKGGKGFSEREIYGDFIIWNAILGAAKTQGKPVIFVTEDVKEDWWLRDSGETIGALPELRKEFIQCTQHHVIFYRVSSFLEASKKFLKSEVSENTLSDVNANAKSVVAEVTANSGGRTFVSSNVGIPNVVEERLELAGYIEAENQRRRRYAKEKIEAIDAQINMLLRAQEVSKVNVKSAEQEFEKMRAELLALNSMEDPKSNWRLHDMERQIDFLRRESVIHKPLLRQLLQEREAVKGIIDGIEN